MPGTERWFFSLQCLAPMCLRAKVKVKIQVEMPGSEAAVSGAERTETA